MTSQLQLGKKNLHCLQQGSKTLPVVPGYPTLSKDDVKLSEKGLSQMQREEALRKITAYLHAYKKTAIGFQSNQNLDVCSDVLKDYLNMNLNNGGDPFTQGNCCLNTKVVECAVLDYFAKLWNIDLPNSMDKQTFDVEEYWGYIVSMGCSEANMYAMYNARDYLSGQPRFCSEINGDFNGKTCQAVGTKCTHSIGGNPNAFTPVAFYSESTHYSLTKNMRILRIDTFYELGSGHFPCPLTHPDDYPSDHDVDFLDQNGWPRLVPVNPDGSMHITSLVKLVSAFACRGYPPIVIFNCESHFLGSFDDIQAAISKLVPILKEHGLYERHVYYSSEYPLKFDIRRGFWFHVDGALGAAHLPFVEMAINDGAIENDFPNGFPVFDFRIPEVMSISVSLHKWLGCPFPSGVYMTRRKNQLEPPTDPLYIDGGDTTLSGSRNAHGAIAAWSSLSMKSYEGHAEEAMRNAKVVMFALKLLQELEKDLGEDLWISHNAGSLFICFKQPRKEIQLKYSLACNVYLARSKQGELVRRFFSHVCVMSHVNQQLIEKFVNDLREPGAFPSQDT